MKKADIFQERIGAAIRDPYSLSSFLASSGLAVAGRAGLDARSPIEPVTDTVSTTISESISDLLLKI